MRFTFAGGTAQQRTWAQEAFLACRYPMDALDVPVTITWADPTPCATAHTYMCTTQNGDGSYTITIESWADDATNPNNRGLADPKSQIKSFYMQSLVHEIGHVGLYELITTDALRTKVCGLLWKADVNAGSGRRFGVLADYSLIQNAQLRWSDEIVEALAEIIKVCYFTGDLLFLNRTNWRVDPQEWDELMTLILPPIGLGKNKFTALDLPKTLIGSQAFGYAVADLSGDHIGIVEVTGYELLGNPDQFDFEFGLDHSGLSGLDSGIDMRIELTFALDPPFRLMNGEGVTLATLDKIPPLPWYLLLRLHTADNYADAEVWLVDPTLGIGAPVLSAQTPGFQGPTSWADNLPDSTPYYRTVEQAGIFASNVTIDSMVWTPYGHPASGPPYPFAPQGLVKGGPASIAQLRLGR